MHSHRLAHRTAALLALLIPSAIVLSQAPQRAVGCYVLSWWHRDSGEPIPAPFFPDTIALRSDSSRQAFGGFAVRVSAKWARRTSMSHYYWQPRAADSLTVMQTDGFNGTVLRVILDSSGFSGTARAFTDVVSGQEQDQYRVRGRRAACWGFAAVPPN